MPVRFADGLSMILKTSGQAMLEVGPGQTLSTFVRRHKEKAANQIVLTSLRHPQENRPDTEFLLATLSQLWLSGVAIDWMAFHRHDPRRRIHLPVYPFERRRYWVSSSSANKGPAKNPNVGEWFYQPSWKYTVPPEPVEADAARKESSWLIFEDDCGVGSQLVKELNCTESSITVVRVGQSFSRLSANKYQMNPSQPDDYDALFQDLCQGKNCPTKVVHCWSIQPDPPGTAFACSRHIRTGVFTA
jgi:acyl transferase domain-containing protein